MFEAGLVDEWKLRTWMRMKAESQEEQAELDGVKTSEALYLDDLQGVFVLYALFIAASVAAFLIELSVRRGSRRINVTYMGQHVVDSNTD